MDAPGPGPEIGGCPHTTASIRKRQDHGKDGRTNESRSRYTETNRALDLPNAHYAFGMLTRRVCRDASAPLYVKWMGGFEMTCEQCDGTGKITLFTTVTDCDRCTPPEWKLGPARNNAAWFWSHPGGGSVSHVVPGSQIYYTLTVGEWERRWEVRLERDGSGLVTLKVAPVDTHEEAALRAEIALARLVLARSDVLEEYIGQALTEDMDLIAEVECHRKYYVVPDDCLPKDMEESR